MTVCGECGGIASRVLDFGVTQTRLVSSTTRFFIPGGNYPLHLLDWELHGY